MKKVTEKILLCFLLAIFLPIFADHTAVFLDKSPVIDGMLNDECWKCMEPTKKFRIFRKNIVRDDTEVKIGYDKKWLYFGVSCSHPNPKRMKKEIIQRDGPVHHDESIELFINPGVSKNRILYFHFILNCGGISAEQQITGSKYKRDRDWTTAWKWATKETKSGWEAEIAIPLSIINKHGDPEKITFNIVRNKIVPQTDPQGVFIGDKTEHSLLFPSRKTFHEPDSFGRLQGITLDKIEKPFLVAIKKLELGKVYLKNDKLHRDLHTILWVDKGECLQATIGIAGIDHPEHLLCLKNVLLKGGEKTPVVLPFPIKSDNCRKFVVKILNQDKKVINSIEASLGEEKGDVFSSFLNRSYYTTEHRAVVICRTDLPLASLNQLSIIISVGGNIIAQSNKISEITSLEVSLKNMDIGQTRLNVVLKTRKGTELFRKKLVLTKKTPKPGCEWKIDRVNRIILNNGKPFFPFGVIAAGIKPDDDWAFEKLSKAGFNTFALWCSSLSPEIINKYLKQVENHGLYFLDRPEAFCVPVNLKFPETCLNDKVLVSRLRRDSLTGLKVRLATDKKLLALKRNQRSAIFKEFYDSNLNRMLKAIKLSMNSPCLIGYNLFDEPMLRAFDQHVQGRDIYAKIHSIDGYHPCALLYSSHIPKGKEATDWTDILMTDPYWIPARLYHFRSTVNFVSEITCETRRRADENNQVTWIVPMAEIWSGCYKRAILPNEQKCQTYLAIIHGAKGLIYFRYPLYHKSSWETLCTLAKQMKILAPSILTPDLPVKIIYSPKPAKETFPDIQMSFRQDPDGSYVLLAANSRPYPVSINVRFPFKINKISSMFNQSAIVKGEDCFTDKFIPYNTRAYKIILSDQAAVLSGEIQIRSTPDKESAIIETKEYPRYRPGKKNLLPNPSFEQASLAGWPDYFKCYENMAKGLLIGDKDADWILDSTVAREGKYSLKIVKTSPHYYRGFYTYCAPVSKQTSPFTFSVYLKSNRDNVKGLLGFAGAKKAVMISTDWRRYSITTKLPPKPYMYTICGLQISDRNTPFTVWADAAQIERGTVPTEFEP